MPFNSSGGGGRLANYNRWLNQLEQSPLEETELELQPHIELLGEQVPQLIANGEALLFRAGSGPEWISISVFVVSAFLGIWLIYGIFRSGRL